MGLFDFLKSKKLEKSEVIEKIKNQIFPRGDRDIQAGTDELLFILNNKIDRNLAQSIFMKSMAISFFTKEFDKERLHTHLSGYCIQYFDPEQMKTFYNYLTFLNFSRVAFGRTPSEIRRENGKYFC